LLGYLGLGIVLVLAVMAPLVIGRRLSRRDRELVEAEVAAIEASALALLAGRSPKGS
jgi:hypothetical protein